MKRKGFLKKMIAALCVGALISMPVTVSAAEKEDVLGDWTGSSWASVSFYENGAAKDPFNTKPYAMESGSLEVTNIRTGNTETVHYDLWRGEEGLDKDKFTEEVIKNGLANAVLYQEIKPGKKMVAWNVFIDNVNEGWKTYGPATITKVTGDKNSGTDSSTGSDYKCEHYFEWETTTEPTETADGISSYICSSCGYIKERQPISADVAIRNSILASIRNAEAGATVTFDSKSWLCYPQYVLDALKEKGNISLKTNYTYEGIKYSFTIPAGSDYTNLEQADFYGFMYLFGAFDGIIVE